MSPQPMTIRRANQNDAEALSRIGKSTFTETFAHLYAPADLQAFLDDSHSPEFYAELLGDETCAAWLAEDETGAAVGYCTCGPCGLPAPEMPEKSGELQRLYVEKTKQGSGLGRAFLDIAIGWLEDHFDHVYLGVYEENHRAQKLYEAYGFQKIGEYIFMVGAHPDQEWIMKRNAG
jgi:ribosomal protein S18 acetylase RimI-like enzyme